MVDSTKATTTKKILYQGRLITAHIQEPPAIVSFSVLRDWTPQKTDALRHAVEVVLDANPILTCCLELRKGDKEIVAIQDTYTTKDLYHELPRADKTIPTKQQLLEEMKQQDLLKYLEDNVIPQFPEHISDTTRMGKTEIGDKSPVFEVYVMELSKDYACLAVNMSHVIGDGCIYFQVVEQLNEALLQGQIHGRKINWDGYNKLPDMMPSMVPHPLIVIGFTLGSAITRRKKKAKAKVKREPKIVLLSKEKIHQKKKELVNDATQYLSSNDIIMSALSEAMMGKVTVQSQYVNLRTRADVLEENDAGNYLASYLMDAKIVAKDPNAARRVTATGKNNISPWKCFLPLTRGRFNRSTNFNQITTLLDNTVAYLPAKARLRSRAQSKQAGYFTTIFEFDNDSIGVLTDCPLKETDHAGGGDLLRSLLLD